MQSFENCLHCATKLLQSLAWSAKQSGTGWTEVTILVQ